MAQEYCRIRRKGYMIVDPVYCSSSPFFTLLILRTNIHSDFRILNLWIICNIIQI